MHGRRNQPLHPLRKLKLPRVDDRPKEVLSPQEIDRLLKAAKEGRGANAARDTAILLLLFSTGLRATELLSLRQSDIDWDRGLVMVQRGKGGKAEKALDKYLNHPERPDSEIAFVTETGQPWTYHGFKMLFTRLEQRAGVHCNAHKWRHSCAVQYLRNGGRIETLQEMLGHSTLDMTIHYARLAGVDLATAHTQADPAKALRTRV